MKQVLFVGIGLPSAAANLARRIHAPDAVLIYESGAIGAKPSVLPLSIGDGELAEAVRRTTLWAKRQQQAERAPCQLLFGIAQGGSDP